MPTPKSRLIRDALTTEIRKVVGIGATGTDWRLWVKETSFPAVYTILDSEDAEPMPTRSKEVHAHFRLATIISSTTPEDAFDQLRADIEMQIEDDPALGGLADDVWMSGCGHFATGKSIAGSVYVRDVFVEVIYRHGRGTP